MTQPRILIIMVADAPEGDPPPLEGMGYVRRRCDGCHEVDVWTARSDRQAWRENPGSIFVCPTCQLVTTPMFIASDSPILQSAQGTIDMMAAGRQDVVAGDAAYVQMLETLKALVRRR